MRISPEIESTDYDPINKVGQVWFNALDRRLKVAVLDPNSNSLVAHEIAVVDDIPAPSDLLDGGHF
jgi:hypothetical protein